MNGFLKTIKRHLPGQMRTAPTSGNNDITGINTAGIVTTNDNNDDDNRVPATTTIFDSKDETTENGMNEEYYTRITKHDSGKVRRHKLRHSFDRNKVILVRSF